MPLTKITESDLAGKGVCGQADVPGLSAREMQAKVEEIVRDVVIPNINGNIDNFEAEYATKEELENVILTSGAVTSVFGRAGSITANSGDYTFDQVGAAPAKHAANHAVGGSDSIAPNDIGAAAVNHSHGVISADGKVGGAPGLVLMTGTGGTVEAKTKAASGLKAAPVRVNLSGEVGITLQDNTEYSLTGVTDLSIAGAPVSCHGFITFGVRGVISVTGFTASGGDNITRASTGDVWEFSVADHNGGAYIIWKNWSEE